MFVSWANEFTKLFILSFQRFVQTQKLALLLNFVMLIHTWTMKSILSIGYDLSNETNAPWDVFWFWSNFVNASFWSCQQLRVSTVHKVLYFLKNYWLKLGSNRFSTVKAKQKSWPKRHCGHPILVILILNKFTSTCIRQYQLEKLTSLQVTDTVCAAIMYIHKPLIVRVFQALKSQPLFPTLDTVKNLFGFSF